MAKNILSSLLSMHSKALESSGCETQDSIEILKTIVQCCVESNDENLAYRYQKQVCCACSEVYGPESIVTKRAELYCRELMIRTSPLAERVRLCRKFWQDAKEEYGESSYLVKIIAPLYLMCCSDANEIEELKIVCAEVVNYFGNDDDETSRQLVALCADFDILYGEKSGSVEELLCAVEKAENLFGKDSLVSLRLQNEIGHVYRNQKEFDKAVALYYKLYHVSADKYGKSNRDTIVFQKNYVLNLVSVGEYKHALSETKALEKAVEHCPDKNICPDVNECYALIYMKLGKKKLADHHGRLSVEYNEKTLGSEDLTTEKASFILASKEFSEDFGNCAAFSKMIRYMTLKEQWLFNLFLLSSDITREKVFGKQNQGEYDICLGLALSGLQYLSKDNILSLWEVICNYKSLVGDCELLHSAMSRNPYFSEKKKELNSKINSEKCADITEIQRQILKMTREQNFPEYVNSVHVAEIQKTLKKGELLLDYYCVRFSDLQEYVCVAVTSDTVDLVPVGAIDEIDTLIDGILTAVCYEKDLGSSRETSETNDPNQNVLESFVQRISKLLHHEKTAINRIVICPDGELYRLPFDIIMNNSQIVYVTNAKDIVRNKNGVGSGQLLIKDVYVFADPIFDQDSEQTQSYFDDHLQERSKYLSRLPGTYVEAQIIKRVFGDIVRSFVGENANRQAFLENCNSDILHIGSHATGSDGGIIYLSVEDETKENGNAGPAYVTSKDIAGLNMNRTKLAILSACQTGVGEYRDYLGVRGLRRSFQLAGAETVISTMWNVSDLATTLFMYAFYSNLNETLDCKKALYYAKNYVKTATVEKIKTELYQDFSELLIGSGNMEIYREFRDLIVFGNEMDIPFSSPYYWAGFSLYQSATFED